MGRFHRHDDGTVHRHDHAGAHTHDHAAEHTHDHTHDVGDHGAYGVTAPGRVEVLESIFAENDRVADANRRSLRDAGVRTVNRSEERV